MAVSIPQVVTEDRASGALVVDGSLRFDSRKSQRLTRTPDTEGNRKTWTWSAWVKTIPGAYSASNHKNLFSVDGGGTDAARMHMFIGNASDKIQHDLHSSSPRISSSVYRDVSSWYHVVVKFDSTQSTARNQIAWYINGQQIVNWDTENTITQNNDYAINGAALHAIGSNLAAGPGQFFDGLMTQVYLIDGQALGPEYFGYTDPLTNTWRPKKFKPQATPNNGTIWSSYGSLSANPPTLSGTIADIFDGSIVQSGGTFSVDQANAGVTVSFSPALPAGTTVKLLGGAYGTAGSNDSLQVNGTGYAQSLPSSPGTTTFASLSVPAGANGISSIYIYREGVSTFNYGLMGIEVDGVILLDGDTTNIGLNGFYLPFDGSAPIGQDQSGRGNNWTPVNFGGSAALDQATGALPILNTLGGTVARPGVLGSEVSKYYTTTASTNTSNGFVFENEGTKPTLSFVRGGTYTFDYSASTSHPLYLSSLQNGKWNSKAYSVSFDGTGDYLSVPDHADLQFGTSAFTIECYVWFNSYNSVTYPSIISKYTGGTTSWIMRVKNDGKVVYYDGGGSNNESTTTPIGLNKWHHIAMVREGTGSNQAKMYVDGKLVITTTDATDYTDTQVITIGAQNTSANNALDGYMSNVRIIKGTALYTSDFTPPGTTLTNVTNTKLLCCQDSNAATAAVIPSGSITVGADAAASQSRQPFLYDSNHGNFGVNTATSNVTKITVPHLAADTLYYYCNSHTGMGNSISVTTDTKKADPYAWKCVLAQPLINTALDVSDQINCTSTEKAITANGATASKVSRNFYGGSTYFDGNDNITAPDNNDFDFGTGDFTVEIWARPNATSGDQYIVSWEGGNADAVHNGINIYNGNWRIGGFNDALIGGNNGLVAETWTHIAMSRDSNGLRAFVNGVKIGTSSTGAGLNFDCSSNFTLGKYAGAADLNFTGYMSDLRVYKGVAKYTENFAPASTNPDILPDTPSGVGTKTQLTKITDGAVSFDGAAGTALSLSNNSDIQLGSGTNWTVEFFAYRTGAFVDYDVIAGKGASGTFEWFIEGFADGSVDFLYSTDGTSSWAGQHELMSSMGLNRWYHFAFVRNGSGANNFKMYVDGKQVFQTTAFNIYVGTGVLHIGGYNGAAAQDPPIIISNFRIVNGSSVYTSNFTPPTEPLTAVANTKLLCCQSTTESGSAIVAPNVSGSINTGTQWSKYLTGAGGFQSGYPATNAFNGIISASETSRSTNNGETQTFAPPVGIPYSSKVEVWTWYAGNVSLNGGSNVAVSDDQDWRTIATGSGTLNTLDFICNPGNSMYLAGIRIDSTTILLDPIAPNGNAVATNFNPFTTDINTVRGQEGTYATLNPLDSATTLSDGNLTITGSGTAFKGVRSNIGMTSGKWYMECILRNYSSSTSSAPGIWNDSSSNLNTGGGSYGNAYLFVTDYSSNYRIYTNAGSSNPYSETGSLSNGDLIGIALDLDNGKCYVHINGIYLNGGASVYDTWPADTYFFGGYEYTTGNILDFNFGQKPFKFPPLDGFQPLTLSTLRPDTVIPRPDQYVGVTTYTGNGTSQTISGLNQTPDLVWIKDRDRTDSHCLTDSVRGDYFMLRSDQQLADNQYSNVGIHSLTNNGFSVNSGSAVNTNDSGYVAWTWKAGGNKGVFNVDDVGYATTTAAGLTAGDSSSVTGCSIGTKQGFSIIKYSGANTTQLIPHGLGQAPRLCIVKNLTDGSTNWVTSAGGSGGIFSDSVMFLNTTDTNNAGLDGYWGGTSASSTGVYVGGNQQPTNQDSKNYIMYNWIDVPGLQKFGTYEGTGVAGNYVHLGFRPALIWIKNADATAIQNWGIIDSTRSYANVGNHTLALNLSSGESAFAGGESVFGSGNKIDLLSDGFTLRETSGFGNASGITFVYCAWAEAPSFNLYGAQSNAR